MVVHLGSPGARPPAAGRSRDAPPVTVVALSVRQIPFRPGIEPSRRLARVHATPVREAGQSQKGQEK